jgi:lysyl-tRNA synthetase class 2
MPWGSSDPFLINFFVQAPEGVAPKLTGYLQTSPEFAMKRLLAAGSGDIYELGPVFRALEQGRHHNQEFTLLEWYRNGWSYHQLMDEVSSLVRHCLPDKRLAETRVSYSDLITAYCGIDPLNSKDEDLFALISSLGIVLTGLNREQMLDLIITHVVQPQLPSDAMTFVFDYPPAQAALSKIRQDETPVAERFELFLGKLELANGYQELTDPVEQEARFIKESKGHEHTGQSPKKLDTHLLEAMKAGLPECSGVALGVDRLLMAITGASSINEVLSFTSDKA